jgi:hypothetical protein
MRILLRLIAALAVLSVIATAVFVFRFGAVGLRALLATGMFGLITIIGWIITFTVGPVAAIQLYRLRPSGRIAAAVLFGTMLVYYIVGLFTFREPEAPATPIVALCVFLSALVALVLSPAAKRVCTVEATTANLFA